MAPTSSNPDMSMTTADGSGTAVVKERAVARSNATHEVAVAPLPSSNPAKVVKVGVEPA